MDYIDLFGVDLHSSEADIVHQFREQMGTLGFLCIYNVDGFDEETMLAAVQKLHGISESEKKKLFCANHNSQNSNIYRGLSPFIDNDESHKEIFDMGLPLTEISESERKYPLYEETPFPVDCGYELRSFYRKQFKQRLELGVKLASYIALALGLDRTYFDRFFKDSLSTFRTIYYKPRWDSPVKQNMLSETSMALTTPGHTDSGFITILSTLGFEGLQVLHEGRYRSVRGKKNYFIVNFGDMLSKITNNRVKATMHRVIDIGVERFSHPFFLEPHYSAKIPTNILVDHPNEYIVYGDYLVGKMTSKYSEWKNFKLA